MDVYSADFEVRSKADESPVTEADERAEQIILQGLARLSAGIPVISEEASSRGVQVAAGELFWLVDPLDGTKEFVSRNGEFTVNKVLRVDDRMPLQYGKPGLDNPHFVAQGAA